MHLPVPAGRTLPDTLQVGIRPEDMQLDPAGQFAGRVTLTEPLGVETIVHIQSGEQVLLSVIPGMTPLRLDDAVQFDSGRAVAFLRCGWQAD